MPEHLNGEELQNVYDLVTMVARTAQYVPIEDVQKWLHTISISHALGPIMEPTMYRDGGMDNLQEQKILADGFLTFRQAIEKVKELGLARAKVTNER